MVLPLKESFMGEFREKQSLKMQYTSKVYIAKMGMVGFKTYYWE